jgi:hypothetical protein
MSGPAAEGYGVSVSAWLARPTLATPTLGEAAFGHGPFRSLARPGGEGCRVGIIDAPWMLGVRAPDRSRAILVVNTDGELAIAVCEVVPRGLAVIGKAR